MTNSLTGNSNPLLALRRMAQRKPEVGTCDFCSVELAPDHRHLLELANRKVVCACTPCALRFEGVIGGRFKLIPRNVRELVNFKLTDEQWANFALPINLAFFFQSSVADRVIALYPSPA